jgi:recombinational DNA repair ATPase RecF
LRLKSLLVDGLRNLEIHDLALGSPVTQVYRAGAGGKTNLQESVYLPNDRKIKAYGSSGQRREA